MLTGYFLTRHWALVVLAIACLAFSINAYSSNNEETKRGSNNNKNVQPQSIPRTQRAIYTNSKKPGFIKTLFSVIYEQWTDTQNTLGKVSRMINDNFLPDNAPIKVSTTPPPSTDPNATTTAAPLKITRSEFGRIVRRNLKGLIRLYNIELDDALKQSRINYAEHRKNASREVSKFL